MNCYSTLQQFATPSVGTNFSHATPKNRRGRHPVNYTKASFRYLFLHHNFRFGSVCLYVWLCVCVCYLPQKKHSRHIKSSSHRRYNSCVINHTPFAFCVWCVTACVLRPAMYKRQVFVCVGQKLPKKLYHWHGGRRRGVTQQMANRQKTGPNP